MVNIISHKQQYSNAHLATAHFVPSQHTFQLLYFKVWTTAKNTENTNEELGVEYLVLFPTNFYMKTCLNGFESYIVALQYALANVFKFYIFAFYQNFHERNLCFWHEVLLEGNLKRINVSAHDSDATSACLVRISTSMLLMFRTFS